MSAAFEVDSGPMHYPGLHQVTTAFPNKSAFADAVKFGIRLQVRNAQRIVFLVLNPTDQDRAEVIYLRPFDSVTIAGPDNKWVARVTRNASDNGYAVE